MAPILVNLLLPKQQTMQIEHQWELMIVVNGWACAKAVALSKTPMVCFSRQWMNPQFLHHHHNKMPMMYFSSGKSVQHRHKKTFTAKSRMMKGHFEHDHTWTAPLP